MKSKYNIVWEIAIQRDEQGRHGDFYHGVHMVATKIVPIVIGSKVTVGPLASDDPQVTLSHLECLPQALALSHS